MPYKDRETRLAYHKVYNKKWFLVNREKYNKRLKKDFVFWREQLFDLLGRKCVRCGFDKDIRALQFDHINGGGGKERQKYGGGFCRYYAKRPILAITKLQILCANCNWIKRYEKKEFAKPRTVMN